MGLFGMESHYNSSITILLFVKTHISPAIFRASNATLFAGSLV
jgi:hypothetical protein